MKIKLFISLICIGTSAATAQTQNTDDVSKQKLYLDFGGTVGIFIPYDQVKGQKVLIGSNAMTYLQLNYHRDFFTRLQFGQTTVDFKSQNTFGAVASQVNAKANSTNLGLSVGYQHSFGKWQPFILAGAGASFLDIPVTAFDGNTNTVSYTTASATKLYINAGAGINYKLSKSVILFMEGQGSTIPDLPTNSSTHLSGISVLIGIKAPL